MVPHASEPPTTFTFPPALGALDSNHLEEKSPLITKLPRPSPPRRSTAPDSPTGSSSTPPTTSILPFRPRNRSPFTRTHVRSRSSNSSLSAPLMARAQSSPVPDTLNQPVYPTAVRSSSPLGLPGRRRSPLRKSSDEPFSSFSNQLDIGETISENHELDLTPRAPRETASYNSATPESSGIGPVSPSFTIHNTFPRTRRRPLSPFSSSPSTAGSTSQIHLNPPTSIPLRTSTSSPSLHLNASAIQYNEPYPTYSSYSSTTSSVPSTPTSFRSRSPSISSLETIEDTPDEELEAENIARLKAAADREDAANKEAAGDSGEEGVVRRRGAGLGRSDKRKRWSVCGAERRGDLDLETIWED
ncbi:MAG: hypothetical protein Q9228_005586 [Teloschistes exilis]